MDHTYARVLTAYYSVALGAEIAGLYCLYYVLVAYFKNTPRITFAFRIENQQPPQEQQQQEDNQEQDLDFEPEHFGQN